MSAEEPVSLEKSTDRPEEQNKLRQAASYLGKKAVAVVAVTALAIPAVDFLATRAANKFTGRVEAKSGQLDLSQDQIDNFKRNIENENLLEYMAQVIQEDSDGMTSTEIINCLFNDPESCEPSSTDSSQTTGTDSPDKTINLSQEQIDHFDNRFGIESGLQPGPYNPDLLIIALFGETLADEEQASSETGGG